MDPFFLEKINKHIVKIKNNDLHHRIKSREITKIIAFLDHSDLFGLNNLAFFEKISFFQKLGHDTYLYVDNNLDRKELEIVLVRLKLENIKIINLDFSQNKARESILSGAVKSILILTDKSYRQNRPSYDNLSKITCVLVIKTSFTKKIELVKLTDKKKTIVELIDLLHNKNLIGLTEILYTKSELKSNNIMRDISSGCPISSAKIKYLISRRLLSYLNFSNYEKFTYNTFLKKICDPHKVSVIITTYEGMGFLPDAITSVIEQSYQNIEIIIIDDGSSDGTNQFCNSLIKNGYNVRYFYQKNSGVASSRNMGIRYSTGSIIAFLDHDDFLMEDSIFDRVIPLINNCNTYIVSGRRDTLIKNSYSNSRHTRIEPYQQDGFLDLKSKAERIKYFREKLSVFGFNTMMIRKSIFSEIGYFVENRKYSGIEHNAFILKLLHYYEVFHINSVVYLMRRNHTTNNLSSRFDNNEIRTELLNELLDATSKEIKS